MKGFFFINIFLVPQIATKMEKRNHNVSPKREGHRKF
jgi:hypothetical protein